MIFGIADMGLAIELLNKLATLRETNLEDDLDNMFPGQQSDTVRFLTAQAWELSTDVY